MKKFLIHIFLFSFLGFIIGEIVIRLGDFQIDVPIVYLAQDGLIKYEPNQRGNFTNGEKWFVNSYGEINYEPPSLDSLITVIGDSYIESLMNPASCNQAKLLKDLKPEFNFYPSSRSWSSVLEMLEKASLLEKYNPLKQLLYVECIDFEESIASNHLNPLTVNISLETEKLYFPTINKSKYKEFLHNFKFPFYIYRHFIDSKNQFQVQKNSNVEQVALVDYIKIEKLIQLILKKYNTNKLIFVFKPQADQKLISILRKYNFSIIELKTNYYKSWQLKYDCHWSCYGHQEAAKQVIKNLENSYNL